MIPPFRVSFRIPLLMRRSELQGLSEAQRQELFDCDDWHSDTVQPDPPRPPRRIPGHTTLPRSPVEQRQVEAIIQRNLETARRAAGTLGERKHALWPCAFPECTHEGMFKRNFQLEEHLRAEHGLLDGIALEHYLRVIPAQLVWVRRQECFVEGCEKTMKSRTHQEVHLWRRHGMRYEEVWGAMEEYAEWRVVLSDVPLPDRVMRV